MGSEQPEGEDVEITAASPIHMEADIPKPEGQRVEIKVGVDQARQAVMIAIGDTTLDLGALSAFEFGTQIQRAAMQAIQGPNAQKPSNLIVPVAALPPILNNDRRG